MDWILTITGVVLVTVALRDIFHTLWHPGGFGTLSRRIFTIGYRLAKVGSPRRRWAVLAGPLGLLGTLGAWAVLVVVGFALVYLPRMPRDFYFGSALKPEESSDLVASLYLSLVALTTLGLGDIQPAVPLLRLAVPIEALVGFLLLTAGISWILQLYPALTRRRALARQLTTMGRSGASMVVESGEPSIAAQYLESVRSALATVEMDLVQHGESYYFQDVRSDQSLAAALPQVADLIAAGGRASSADVRNAAMMLEDGLSEFLALLRREFLGDVGDAESTLAKFAEEHQHPGSR